MGGSSTVDLSKRAPAMMLRLPADRPSDEGGGPVVEPSQQICPHWALVVAHQGVREVVYTASDVGRKLCGCCTSASATVAPYKSLGDAKKVLFVRHGQGAHNQTIANWGLVDPELTPTGEAQVADLYERLQPHVGSIELIAVSPLTRAMQTATGGFAGCNAPYVVTPLLRERLGAPCDTGRTRTELLRCFPRIAKWEGMDELPEVLFALLAPPAPLALLVPLATLATLATLVTLSPCMRLHLSLARADALALSSRSSGGRHRPSTTCWNALRRSRPGSSRGRRR